VPEVSDNTILVHSEKVTLADLLIPAGSAVAGALVGGGTTIYSQMIAQSGTRVRDREARQDAFESRRFEIERDTLLALQDAVEAHRMTWSSHVNGELSPEARATDMELLNDWGKVVKLAHRVLDRDAAKAAEEYCVVANRAVKDPYGERENIIRAYGDAQKAIGTAIRQDPYEPKATH
jgi:hypothetical protein